MESYGVIQSFINLPLFFLSGALFPIRGETVPSRIQTVSVLNPLTYSVDALRIIILGDAWQPLHSLFYDVLIIGFFDLVMIAIGTLAFGRRKQHVMSRMDDQFEHPLKSHGHDNDSQEENAINRFRLVPWS